MNVTVYVCQELVIKKIYIRVKTKKTRGDIHSLTVRAVLSKAPQQNFLLLHRYKAKTSERIGASPQRRRKDSNCDSGIQSHDDKAVQEDDEQHHAGDGVWHQVDNDAAGAADERHAYHHVAPTSAVHHLPVKV